MPPHLFGPAGERAIASVLAHAPLLAFDFDGTLAPIALRPDDVRVSAAVSTHLAQLAQRLPVAIVTGRSVDDVRPRLGFEPHYIVGNHGAEDDRAAGVGPPPALDALRARIAAAAVALGEAGVSVEDKRLSVALHFRLARDRAAAEAAIDAVLRDIGPGLRRFGGKCVVNVVDAAAPDKAEAVRALLARCGRTATLFVGDDVNDEPVFEAAEAAWLTVRVGRVGPTRANFRIDGPGEMADLLQRLRNHLDDAARRLEPPCFRGGPI